MSTVKNFSFSVGYVESSTLPILFLQHDLGFGTVYEALLSLADVLRASYKERWQVSYDQGKSMSNVDLGDEFERFFTMCVDDMPVLLDRLEQAGWSAVFPSAETLAETVHIEDALRVMATVGGSDAIDRLLWDDLKNYCAALTIGFVFELGLPDEDEHKAANTVSELNKDVALYVVVGFSVHDFGLLSSGDVRLDETVQVLGTSRSFVGAESVAYEHRDNPKYIGGVHIYELSGSVPIRVA